METFLIFLFLIQERNLYVREIFGVIRKLRRSK